MRRIRSKQFDWILIGIAVLAAFLNIYNIWKDKYANAYYTSAVASMMQSFHNFFFASFDPAGFVTVDKPPVTFWVQTIFAYIFGLHGWSVVLPQALAGIGSVLLIYVLVKPSFGRTAARFSSLIVACTPIAVAVSRTNNVDSLLVFTLLLATWLLFRAIRNEKWSWAVAAFAVIGIAFNEKMLEAYMVLPAFYLFYLVAFKTNWKKKLGVLAGATVIMLTISLSWAIVVDAIPKDSRPYVGSSQTNSVLELAFGYNGISRLTGNGVGVPGGGFKAGDRTNQQQLQTMQTQNGGGPMPPGFNPDLNGKRFGGTQGPQGGGMFNTGQPGPLRLFQTALSGQISWLLPLVGFACIGLLAGVRKGKKLTAKQQESIFWLAWLLPVMAFFSVASFFHQYYLIMLAPPIAVLAGAGWVELWKLYRRKEGWKSWILPTGLLAATLFQLYVLQPYIQVIGTGWSIGIGASGIGLSLVLLLVRSKKQIAYVAALSGMLVLLAAPLYWAATPLLYGDNSMMPAAGPENLSGRGMPGSGRGMPGMGEGNMNTKLLDYVTKNNTGETYLFATTNAGTAESYIIETGKAVMAMGGFSGSDPILTVDKLKQMVEKKEVKFFLISSGTSGGPGGFGGPGGGDSKVLDWIRSHSTEVSKDQWQSNVSNSMRDMGMGGSMTLYEINP